MNGIRQHCSTQYLFRPLTTGAPGGGGSHSSLDFTGFLHDKGECTCLPTVYTETDIINN